VASIYVIFTSSGTNQLYNKAYLKQKPLPTLEKLHIPPLKCKLKSW